MGESNLIESFREWTRGGLELVKPWKWALILTNLFWAITLVVFIWFAYMAPVDMGQEQDFSNQVQNQYSESQGGGS